MLKNKVLLYEGKAKQVYQSDDANHVIIHYKDDATAGNGAKKAIFLEKGVYNAAISTYIFEYLAKNGIKTHYIQKLTERDVLCEKVDIILLEVIVRNIATGSLTQRLGVPEGKVLQPAVLEISYKNDAFGDPLINDDHVRILNLATAEQLQKIYHEARKINKILQELFTAIKISLIDFKIEFGVNDAGDVVLADEISPDTCRLWDMSTQEKLDKDRFRQDLGNVMEAYKEIKQRLEESGKIK